MSRNICATLALMLLWISTIAQIASKIPFPGREDHVSTVIQRIGPVEVGINYNGTNVVSPSGKDRTDHIWGELVPFGMHDSYYPDWVEGGASGQIPWRAGSNENTTISFSHDVLVEGQALKAGVYGLLILVEKDSPWTIIFSKASNNWGGFFYKENEDALRIKVPALDNPLRKWLSFGFDNRLSSSTTAYMEWEKKRIEFKIEVPNVKEINLAVWRSEMFGKKGLFWENWVTAVNYCINNNTQNWDEVLTWSDYAIYGAKNFRTMSLKAKVLEKLGREEDAEEQWKLALAEYQTNLSDLAAYASWQLARGKNEKAIAILNLAKKRFPDDLARVELSIARVYRNSDKKTAIAHYESAIKKWPVNRDTQSLNNAKTELSLLQGGS